MATWAPGTIVRDTGLGGGRRKLKITGAVPHIGAARSVLGFVVAPNSRSNYPTYHIASDGTLTGIVHPDRRPFTTAHSVDETAITFEIDNTIASHPWPISEAALMTLERVLLHHAREEGFSRFVLNRPGVDQTRDGFFIGGHRQYKQVACPGDWLWGRWPGIIDGLNRKIAGKAPASAPAPPPDPEPVLSREDSDMLPVLVINKIKGHKNENLGWKFSIDGAREPIKKSEWDFWASIGCRTVTVRTAAQWRLIRTEAEGIEHRRQV